MPLRQRLLLCLAIAAGYFALARLGLLMAVPPGYATAIWPPAGLAFGACLIWGWRAVSPGILAGSWLTNATLGGSLDLGFLPLLIAVGSTLQACAGEVVLRRIDPLIELSHPRSVARFSFAAMLACVVAASIGNFALLWAGVIQSAQWPENFATWWLGDALGVQIFAPLTLVLFDRRPVWSGRRLQAGIPLCVAFALCVLLYSYLRQGEETQLTNRFATESSRQLAVQGLNQEAQLNGLRNLALYLELQQDFDEARFSRYARQILQQNPHFRAVEWAPLVPRTELTAFERRTQAAGSAGFRVHALGNAEAGLPAVPVMYAEPRAPNRFALGLDLTSEERRADVVRRAMATGQPAASARIVLKQDPNGPGAVLVAVPVKAADGKVRGLVIGVIDFASIAVRLSETSGARWSFADLDNRGDSVQGPQFRHPPRFEGDRHIDGRGVYYRASVLIADRHWEFLLHKPAGALTNGASLSLVVLVLALVVCAALGVFALVISGHAQRVEREVAQRTAELSGEIVRRQRVEADLRATEQQAQAANRAKSRFLATMSHEIRTPLNGILGMAQLLQMPGLSEAEQREFADTIVASGQDLLAILNDVLDLSKVEAGKVELDHAPLVPFQVASEVVRLYSASAESKGLTLAVEWNEAATGLFMGDAGRLRQMLTNLVNNAIKFTASGGVRIQAQVLVAEGACRLRYTVRDTGVGIPADKLGLLFQPFTQLDGSSTRQHGGTGLGLSIVQRLADLMEGSVGVNSLPGEGTEFWFEVPVSRAEVV